MVTGAMKTDVWTAWALVLLGLVSLPSSCALHHEVTSTPDQVPQVQAYSASLDVPTSRSLSLFVSNGTSSVSGDGPRRRPREQWDMVGPALLLGGTLALLVLAAIGHLASKALLASMLSAALSAVQLSRQPAGPRPG